MQYFVRLRDVISGAERWLECSDGTRFMSGDQRVADCVAFAAGRVFLTEYAFPVEMDTECEMRIE